MFRSEAGTTEAAWAEHAHYTELAGAPPESPTERRFVYGAALREFVHLGRIPSP